jgi:hypothetical protein
MYTGLRLLSAGHVSTLLHPHCTPGPSPCIYNRKGQGPHTGGWSRGTLSLSPSRTLVTHTASAPTLAQDNTKPRFSPFVCSVSRQPIWDGARSDNLLVGPGTPQGRNADNFSFQKIEKYSENMKNYRRLLKGILTCFTHLLHLETLCNDMSATTKASLGLIPLGLRQYKTK